MSFLDWPVPPPFMFICALCTEMLQEVPRAEARDLKSPYGDDLLRLQIRLATHVVTDHQDAVPEPHTDGCKLCVSYAGQATSKADQVWSEHRARDLFLPEKQARML